MTKILDYNGELPISVYLANSYSSHKSDPDEASLERHTRRLLESSIGGRLKKKFQGKYCFLLPIALSASMDDLCKFGHGFDNWAREDFKWVSQCDELWVLMSSGWKESYGVQSEIAYAHKLKKTVKFVDSITLEVYDSYDYYMSQI